MRATGHLRGGPSYRTAFLTARRRAGHPVLLPLRLWLQVQSSSGALLRERGAIQNSANMVRTEPEHGAPLASRC